MDYFCSKEATLGIAVVNGILGYHFDSIPSWILCAILGSVVLYRYNKEGKQ